MEEAERVPSVEEVEAVARAIYEDLEGWFDGRFDVRIADVTDTARAAIIRLDQVRGK